MEAGVRYPLKRWNKENRRFGGTFSPERFTVTNYFDRIVSLNLYDEDSATKVCHANLDMSPKEARVIALALLAVSEGQLKELEGQFRKEE